MIDSNGLERLEIIKSVIGIKFNEREVNNV